MELQADKAERLRTMAVTPERIFYANYDLVWKAALTVLKYSITDQNQETGHIETDFVKASDGGWLAPDQKRPPSSGVRYKILMSFVRVNTDSGRVGVKVTIDKRIEKVRDFFSDPEPVPTDGLEEKAIFYRMEREIVIDQALRKLSNDSSEIPL